MDDASTDERHAKMSDRTSETGSSTSSASPDRRASSRASPRSRHVREEAAFDGIAGQYDAGFSESRLGRLLRTRVHERLSAGLPESARVLELGCGTGEDAAFLAGRGHRVLGTDASEAMLEIARQKLSALGYAERVRFRRCRLQDLASGEAIRELVREAPFDAVLANFGVLNCTERWREISAALAPLLRPEGRCVLVLMGRYCPWEWLWYGVRGRFPTALRRLSGRATARLDEGPDLEVHYPTPPQLSEAFAPAFRRVRLEGLGAVLPPSYGSELLEDAPGWARRLDRWDRLLGATTTGAWLSDHYLIELERTADAGRRRSPVSRAHPSTGEPSERSGLPGLACPRCGTGLRYEPLVDGSASSDSTTSLNSPVSAECPSCEQAYGRREEIWRLLTADRAREIRPFLAQYGTVRAAEARGSDDPGFYRALPFEDRTGRFAEDWSVRAQSYRAFAARVLAPLEDHLDRPLRVLDLGAGNGWLSNRLAERGHRPVALDLRVDDRDGLGARSNYENDFPAVQADFRDLPFEDRVFDLAVFNASLHYAPDLERAVREAARVLRREGRIAIVDTPLYRDPASGRQMVREREEAFEADYGFRSNALDSEGFLTHERLDQLAEALGLTWTRYRPRRNLRRMLAPWTAWLKGEREPARLPVIEGRVT